MPLGTQAVYLIDANTFLIGPIGVDEAFQGKTYHMEREWLDLRPVQGILYPSRMSYPGTGRQDGDRRDQEDRVQRRFGRRPISGPSRRPLDRSARGSMPSACLRASICPIRALMIFLTRAMGIGCSGVKWMPPLVVSKPLRSCLKASTVVPGKKLQVVLERGEASQIAALLEARHPVADAFDRLGRGGLDRGPQLLEGPPRRLGNAGQVGVDVLRPGLGALGRGFLWGVFHGILPRFRHARRMSRISVRGVVAAIIRPSAAAGLPARVVPEMRARMPFRAS